ncbi:hypothetical protein ACOMHN_054020 [Nucella lapillus]
MSGESVKVAVRVRPFNQREKDRKATLIIKMQGNMTLIQNPETPILISVDIDQCQSYPRGEVAVSLCCSFAILMALVCSLKGFRMTVPFNTRLRSHDGFETLPDGVLQPSPGSAYANQRHVFEDLGQGVLNNAFEGYNCSLFAYGQTGSGKSYSVVGYGQNKGIVPITCDELFKTMQNSGGGNTVSLSV